MATTNLRLVTGNRRSLTQLCSHVDGLFTFVPAPVLARSPNSSWNTRGELQSADVRAKAFYPNWTAVTLVVHLGFNTFRWLEAGIWSVVARSIQYLLKRASNNSCISDYEGRLLSRTHLLYYESAVSSLHRALTPHSSPFRNNRTVGASTGIIVDQS